jgi:hypothetical protein
MEISLLQRDRGGSAQVSTSGKTPVRYTVINAGRAAIGDTWVTAVCSLPQACTCAINIWDWLADEVGRRGSSQRRAGAQTSRR